jgi:hypothetical protein
MIQSLLSPKKVDVGWHIDREEATFAFYEPENLFKMRDKPLSRSAVQACPSVNELEREYFVIRCPFNLELRCEIVENEHQIIISHNGTHVDSDILRQFLSLFPPMKWRQENVPIVQVQLPYFFLSDTPCYMTLLAPYMSKNMASWPGVLVGGKMPIHIWPRILNWAFEWTDLNKSLTLKRGQDLCYLHFNTANLVTRPNLFELEYTEKLKRYRQGHEGVTNYMSNTFSLFGNAVKRRPKKLLVKKRY